MWGVILAIIMALAFLVMSIFLIQGKGSWLIAGYNTASASEKEKYNEKKLCKSIGFTSLIIFMLLCIMAYLGYKVETGSMNEDKMLPFAMVFIAVVIATIIFDGWYIDKKCKK